MHQLKLKSTDKTLVFDEVEQHLNNWKLQIATRDLSRPWGGFFVLREDQAELFGQLFFPDVRLSDLYLGGKLSPKILIVQAGKRLSWQYHHRRAEIWRVISGKVGVVTSDTDKEGHTAELNSGDLIRLAQGQRHRLVGLDTWGIVAEIWQHTDAARPSDEADIIRLQDDFGR
jgi:mannose-6-phosphate isomerase-like protein (cupin superfamily)